MNGKVLFEIPELKIRDSIDLTLLKSSKVTITGSCRAVYGTVEESIISKDIKITY